jgi:hypothetical protein
VPARAQTLATPEIALTTGEVAATLAFDASPSQLAHINPERVAIVAQHLRQIVAADANTPAAWDDALFWNVEASVAERSQYFAIGNAINFRYWRLGEQGLVPAAGLIGGEAFRGAMYMWRSLRRCIDQQQLPLLDAGFLSNITGDEFDVIFSDDSRTNPLDIAREERLANLRNLGTTLADSWGGLFYNVACASRGSIVEFARLSSTFRAFDDPLFKLTMVNAIVHSGSGVYLFRDEPLPAIDYHLLRHALRQGMVEPETFLEAKLREGRLLSEIEAYELRRVTLAVFLRLAEQTGLSGELLDNKYWLNRGNCSDNPVCLEPDTAELCPFLDACLRATAYRLPLELTRYY